MRLSDCLFIAVCVCTTLFASVQVYDYSDPVERSDLYEVTLAQGGKVQKAFVHITRCPKQENPREKILPLLYDRTFSWASFAFDEGPVEVTVTKHFGERAHDVIVAPKRVGVTPLLHDGHTVQFRLERPEYVSVRFVCAENTDEYGQIRHGLMLFGDASETGIPPKRGDGIVVYKPQADLENARVIVFEPGVYDFLEDLPNGMLPVHDHQEVYIPGGTFIYGGITAPSSVNVKVYGRGILCGIKQRFHYPGLPQLCELEPWNYRTNIHRGGHATVEGITLLNSFNHNLAVGTHSLVKDVKFIAWKVNNDGIRSGDHSVIDHCFMKVSDDHVYAFSSTLVRRCLFWPMWNGAILQLGWGDYGGNGTRFVNNDIINPEWNQWWYNNGVIASQVRPNSQNSDILIQDLRIEGDINALANLHFNSDSRGTGPWSGYIKDITFRNVTVDGRQLWMNGQEGWYDTIPDDIQFEVVTEAPVRLGRSLIRGHQDKEGHKATIHHVVFEDVSINGEVLTEANHGNYVDVDKATTHDIRFIQTQNHDPELSFRPGYARSDNYTLENLGAGSYLLKGEQPWSAEHAGWLAAEKSCSWSIDLPQAGLYDLKISVACGRAPARYVLERGGNV